MDSGMRDYRLNRRSKINGEPITLTATADNLAVQLTLDAEKCQEFYHKALGDLLEIFSKAVQNARNRTPKVQVLLRGGTFQNDHLLQKAKAIVLDAGLIWDESSNLTIDAYGRYAARNPS